MRIQIERIRARSRPRRPEHCSAPGCESAAIWFLVDHDMPATHDANLGRRPCCTTHIAATYVQLRGANVVANAAQPSRPEAGRPFPKRGTIALVAAEARAGIN